jgi:hypothetical protein
MRCIRKSEFSKQPCGGLLTDWYWQYNTDQNGMALTEKTKVRHCLNCSERYYYTPGEKE